MPRNKRRVLLWAFGSTVGVLFVLGAAATTYAFYYAPRFLPRTTIGGVAVGGLKKEDALAALSAKEKQFLITPLTITYGPKQWEIAPADFQASVSTDAAADSLWEVEKGGAWWHQLAVLFKSPFTPHQADAQVVAYTQSGEQALVSKVFSQVETPYQETALTVDASGAHIVPGVAGQQVARTSFQTDLAADFAHDANTIALSLVPFLPNVPASGAQTALAEAQQVLAAPLTLELQTGNTVTFTQADLQGWLTTVVEETPTPHLALSLKPDLVNARLADIAKQIDTTALNAQLAFSNGAVTVVDPGHNGVSLDQAATLAALQQYVQSDSYSGSVAAVIGTVQAAVRPDNYQALGLNTRIGTNTTDFSGSPTNRVANIGVGSRSLNLLLINDGDTFSTLGALGPIDQAHGYLPELSIIGTRTVPEDGGGLCQVSTTLFRSVLNAGLPIVERQNHSYRVSYYERGVGPGLDATIYSPSPDFKWKNDTGHPIYLESSVKGNTITFDLYGTSDGRIPTISPPTILATYPVGDPIYAQTDTLDKGVVQQVEHAHDGAKTTVSYTVMRNGQQIYHQDFVSVYKAWPAQFLVGTHDPSQG